MLRVVRIEWISVWFLADVMKILTLFKILYNVHIMETLGDRLKTLRKAKDLQQTELATLVGTSGSMISCIESGKHKPTLELLMALSEFFGVTTDYLLLGKEQRAMTSAENELMSFIRNNAGLMQSLTNILNESKNISNWSSV